MKFHPNLPWFRLEPDLAWYEDSGHGWLAVPLHRFPEAATYSSNFSFRISSGELRWLLLEEDVDAGAFLKVHTELTRNTLETFRISDFEGEQLRSLPRGEQA
jgi:hypothetical protein